MMDLKRPDRVPFELEFNKETAIQVFDGVQGWKLRPHLNRKEVEPFSPEEMKTALKQGQLDGLLIDRAAKGTILSPPREYSGTVSDAQRSCAARGIAYTTASCPPSRRVTSTPNFSSLTTAVAGLAVNRPTRRAGRKEFSNPR